MIAFKGDILPYLRAKILGFVYVGLKFMHPRYIIGRYDLLISYREEIEEEKAVLDALV